LGEQVLSTVNAGFYKQEAHLLGPVIIETTDQKFFALSRADRNRRRSILAKLKEMQQGERILIEFDPIKGAGTRDDPHQINTVTYMGQATRMRRH
jgi:hypothetical protein